MKHMLTLFLISVSLHLTSAALAITSENSNPQPQLKYGIEQSVAKYTELEKHQAYENLVTKGYSVTYEAVSSYLENPPYTNGEYRQFFLDHGMDAVNYTDQLLNHARINDLDVFVGLDYGITSYRIFLDTQIDPPDYQAAWITVQDKLPDIAFQIGCNFVSGGFCVIWNAYEAIRIATDFFSAWWISTQNKWGINNQLLFYKIYRDQWNIPAPFQDDLINWVGGYLYL